MHEAIGCHKLLHFEEALKGFDDACDRLLFAVDRLVDAAARRARDELGADRELDELLALSMLGRFDNGTEYPNDDDDDEPEPVG
jgi:hypothetical protein